MQNNIRSKFSTYLTAKPDKSLLEAYDIWDYSWIILAMTPISNINSVVNDLPDNFRISFSESSGESRDRFIK
jgi:hypothetical protein